MQNRKLKAGNCEVALLRLCQRYPTALGIDSSIPPSCTKPRNKAQRPCYNVEVSGRDDMLNFLNEIGFLNWDKHQELYDVVVDGYAEPLTPEQLFGADLSL